MIARLLRTLAEKRRLDRALRARKAIHNARSASAIKGQSTYWKSAGAKARAMFGETA